jgi:hypothetical protein
VCRLPNSHSFKNRTGPAVEPGKTGTRALSGSLSALDQLRKRARINRQNRSPTAGFHVLNQASGLTGSIFTIGFELVKALCRYII